MKIGGFIVIVGMLLLAPSPGYSQFCLTYSAGAADGFSAPVEPSFPSLELQVYATGSWPQMVHRTFDLQTVDTALIHTFTGWAGPVCGASLEIRVRGGRQISTNDSIRLELVGGTDHQRAFLYWTTIRNMTGSWGAGDDVTLTLDLGNLPDYVDFPTNILPALADGDLDLLVEDDTAIDYATLTVCQCLGPGGGTTPVLPTTWGGLKSSYR